MLSSAITINILQLLYLRGQSSGAFLGTSALTCGSLSYAQPGLRATNISQRPSALFFGAPTIRGFFSRAHERTQLLIAPKAPKGNFQVSFSGGKLHLALKPYDRVILDPTPEFLTILHLLRQIDIIIINHCLLPADPFPPSPHTP